MSTKLSTAQAKALRLSAWANGKAIDAGHNCGGKITFKTATALEKRGLVTFSCEDSRRGWVIRITEEGRQVLANQ